MEIDKRNRVKSRNESCQHQGRPRTIICQFKKFKDKQEILKKCRETKRNRDLHLQRFFKRYHGFRINSLVESTTVSKTK